ncbi:MAG: DUF3108 domain-containing protein [Flavobacteriales bacterium]|nr:DUF3108 domain-containing protein [Flavobacteriales bacterium]
MKRMITLLSIAILFNISANANAQEADKVQEIIENEDTAFKYRKVENKAFKVGEFLKYKLAYGFLNAGEATLEIKEAPKKIQGRDILWVEGRGYSISAFDWFFKVRDQYDTYLDAQGIFPWLFVRRIEEGGYKKQQDYQFFQNKRTVTDVKKEKQYEVPHGIQDMISSFYYARTIDFTGAKKGQIFEFEAFVDAEIIPIRIKYAGTKTVKVDAGKFECMVFHPAVQEGRIFKDDDALTVYITKDENKIPVLAKAKILIGSVRMELIDYKNLSNPIAKK